MEIIAWIAALAAAYWAGRLMFGWFFGCSEEFWECVRFSLTPDIFSMFRGEYFEDMVKSFKLSAYVGLTALSGFLAYSGVMGLGGS